MKNTINIFSETGCISHDVLWKYKQGTLSASEKHQAELHLTDCELCSDALAGMIGMNSDAVISELRESVRKISVPKKVIRFYDFRIIAAAAAVTVFFVFLYVINSTKQNERKEIAQLVKPAEKTGEDSFAVSNLKPTEEIQSAKKDRKSTRLNSSHRT